MSTACKNKNSEFLLVWGHKDPLPMVHQEAVSPAGHWVHADSFYLSSTPRSLLRRIHHTNLSGRYVNTHIKSFKAAYARSASVFSISPAPVPAWTASVCSGFVWHLGKTGSSSLSGYSTVCLSLHLRQDCKQNGPRGRMDSQPAGVTRVRWALITGKYSVTPWHHIAFITHNRLKEIVLLTK